MRSLRKILVLVGILGALVMGTKTLSNESNFSATQIGPVAYYKFDGNYEDDSGNSNHGTPIGKTSFISGKVGQALKLDGISNPGYVRVSNNNSLQFTDKLTVAFFLRMDGSYGQTGADCSGGAVDKAAQTVFAKRGDRKGFYANFVVSSDEGKLSSGYSINVYNPPRADIGDSFPYQIGEWTHLAFVIDSGTLIEYVNGEEVARKENQVVNFTRANSEDLYIGIQNNTGYACLDFWFPLNGAIDELRFYNRALSQDEIKTLTNITPPTNNPPYIPSNPSPSTGSSSQSINTTLSWQGGDPDGDTVVYGVYFGTQTTPPLVSNDQTQTTYNSNTLKYNTTYYWKIVATDNHGSSTSCPIWQFTTTSNDGIKQITSGDFLDYSPDWSPDGSMIIFHSNRDNRTTPPSSCPVVWDIYGVNVDTAEIQQLTDNRATYYYANGLQNPRFLGTSSSTIVVEDVNFYYEYMRVDISNVPATRTIIDGTEANFDSLLLIPGGMGGYYIISSPDGSLLAWEIYYPSLKTEVRVANIFDITPGSQGNFGPSATQVGKTIFSTGRVWGISFSPDGSKIAISASKDGKGYDIYIAKTDGSGTPTRLTTSGQDRGVKNIMPDWSKDNQIAFESNQTGRSEIYVINPDGSGLIQVTFDGGGAPSWSPDSQHIAFVSSRTGNDNIWIASLYPGENQPPNTPGNPSPSTGSTNQPINTTLSWQGGDPDGDTVVYGVCFGTQTTPPLVSNDQTQTTYNPGTLKHNTTYYWRIVATDNHGSSTQSSIWQFTTSDTPYNPMLSIPSYGPNKVTAFPKTIVSYVIRVQNNGSMKDTILLTTQTIPQVDGITLSTDSVILSPGESKIVNLYAEIKGDGSEIKITVTGTSQGDSSKKGSCEISYDSENWFPLRVRIVFYKISLSFDVPKHVKKCVGSQGTWSIIDLVFDPKNAEENLREFFFHISDNDTKGSASLKIEFPNDYNIIATDFDVSEDGYSFPNWPLIDLPDWVSEKTFLGHCYGMSATSILYFTGALTRPYNATSTYCLPKKWEVTTKISLYQFSLESFRAGNQIEKSPPLENEEYKKLKEGLKDGPVIITGFFAKKHSVVAYKIIEFSNKAYILLYDNRSPHDSSDQKKFLESFYCAIYDFESGRFKDVDGNYSKFVVTKPELVVQQILLSIKCPVNVQITDQHGRIIASDGTNQIPDADMIIGSDTKIFSLPATLTYSTQINAYDKGSFTLSVTTPTEDGDSYAFVAFENIPISSSTKASITLQPDTGPGSMSIDYDGNNVVDELRMPDSSLTQKPFIAKSEGGTLTLQDGTRIIIPQNVLSEDAEVMLSSAISNEKMALIKNANDKIGPFIAQLQSIKAVREIIIRRILDGSVTTNLNGNLTLSIPYPDTNNDGYIDGTEIKEGCLGIFTLNEEKREWKMVSGSQIDTNANLVSVQVNHLSIFSLMANVITSITHNATTPLGIGSVLTVAMQGQAGGTATFTIACMATTTMTEVSSGTYQGTYTVREGDYIIDGIVTGWLQLGTQTYRMDATTTVTLKGVRDNLTNVIAYPNPCKDHNKITFKNLTDQYKIRIYNIAGELIYEKELTNTNGNAEWNLKNRSGKDVASGVYIYLITNNQNQKATGKIGVIR